MLRIRREKRSRYWYCVGTHLGVRVYRSCQTTDRKQAEEFRREIERQLYERVALGRKPAATFAEAVDAYLNAGRDDRFLLPLLDRWGDLPLSEITQERVDRVARDLYGTPATRVRQVYAPVSAILHYAAEIGLEGATVRPIKKPKVQRKPVAWATDDYLDRLLPHCGPALKAVLLIMTTTGLRTSEVLKRTPKDFQIREGWLFVAKTKTGDEAWVPLPPVAYEAAKAVGFTFPWAQSPALARALRRACAAAGVEYMKAHSVGRHGFSARLLAAGHSLALVARAGRWKSINTVAQNYGHLEADAVHEAVHKAAEKRKA